MNLIRNVRPSIIYILLLSLLRALSRSERTLLLILRHVLCTFWNVVVVSAVRAFSGYRIMIISWHIFPVLVSDHIVVTDRRGYPEPVSVWYFSDAATRHYGKIKSSIASDLHGPRHNCWHERRKETSWATALVQTEHFCFQMLVPVMWITKRTAAMLACRSNEQASRCVPAGVALHYSG